MSFYNFDRVGAARYQERYGADFEDFKVGQRFMHRPGVTLTQQDNTDESLDTMNSAMLHYDANYAGKTAWGKPLMVSTITLQRAIGMAAVTFGRKRCIPMFHEIAMTAPVFGGDTLYANLYMAYDTLSDGMKAVIANLRTVNLYNKKKKRPAAMTPTAPEQDAEPAEHPLVRTHPETGKKALYLCNPGITRHIAGMSEEESQPLLKYLLDHATRPEFTCRFRWQVGSLAVWDNRRALHYPVNDYYGYRRVMHRITIEGEHTY